MKMNRPASAVPPSGPRLHRIEDLRAEFGEPVAAEIARVLGDGGARAADDIAVSIQELRRKHPVYRVSAVADGSMRSVIVKRLDLDAAQRNRLVLHRWLPWLGFADAGAALLGAAGGPGADSIWQIYQDAGDATLHAHRFDRERVTAAVETIAELHSVAANHPVVAECRRDGNDLGMHFFTNAVGDALGLLDQLEQGVLRPSREQVALRDRLRGRLATLLDDTPRRAQVMAEAGGPDTLLHGDLWTTNIILHRTGRGGIRLIDWDRVGAGSFTYDLSILLYRFAANDRAWMLDCYRSAAERAGRRLAGVPELNLLFDTAECARFAYCMSWPAIALLEDGADWAFPALAEIDAWFQAREPAIPQ
jgi:tRNA A-37 threonylcarbamoyl transferase component Bud32